MQDFWPVHARGKGRGAWICDLRANPQVFYMPITAPGQKSCSGLEYKARQYKGQL